jgi:hypothetical protein
LLQASNTLSISILRASPTLARCDIRFIARLYRLYRAIGSRCEPAFRPFFRIAASSPPTRPCSSDEFWIVTRFISKLGRLVAIGVHSNC